MLDVNNILISKSTKLC